MDTSQPGSSAQTLAAFVQQSSRLLTPVAVFVTCMHVTSTY